MDIDEQIKETEDKILEMGMSDVPPKFLEDEEYHLLKLKELKLNNDNDS